MKNPSAVSLSEATQNLNRVLSTASPENFSSGLAWYQTAHTEALLAATVSETDFETFCKIVAILSPSTRWENNLKAAQNLIGQYKEGAQADNLLPCGTRYYANARKALGVIAGTVGFVSSGTGKTFSFYQNIFNPAGTDYITVDYHIYNASVKNRVTWKQWCDGEVTVNKLTYSTISDAIRLVAIQNSILPLQAQAVLWLSQKALYPGKNAKED